jgi:predicted adenylyl cyclase CyaB
MNQTKSQFEWEKRFLLHDRKEFEEKLSTLGAEVTYHAHVIDHWFLPKAIHSRAEHDKWFDEERKSGVRIREQENKNGKKVVSLGTKRLTEDGNHNTFAEAETTIDSYENGKKVLVMMDFKEFLTIDKDRVMYKYQDFNISIDSIKNFKTGVEIELVSKNNTNRTQALAKIDELANKLGLSKKDLLPKSLTVSAMEQLAHFE